MKSLPLFFILLLLSGCYTQVKIVQPVDNSDYLKPRPRTSNQQYNSQEYDENEGEYVDGEQIYQEGFEDGFDRGANAFVDWNVANRWSPYYNRFYWSDSYWNGAFYDSCLWDPYYGYYAGWGLSYYQFGFSRWNNFGGICCWNNGWGNPYWGRNNNVIIVVNGNNQRDGKSRWSYGPRTFGNDIQSPVRVSGRSSGVAKTSGNSGKNSNGKIKVPVRPSRSGSQNKYKPSNGSSSGGSSSGGNKSGSSSGGSARPSRTGDNSATLINDFSNRKAIIIPSGYGKDVSSQPSSSGIASSGSSSSVSTKTSHSSKSQSVKVHTRSSSTATKSTSSTKSKPSETKARSSRKRN